MIAKTRENLKINGRFFIDFDIFRFFCKQNVSSFVLKKLESGK